MSPLVVDLGITDPVTVETTIQNIITIIVRTIIARTITIIFVDFTGGVIGRIVIDRPFYDLRHDRTCATLLGDEHDLLVQDTAPQWERSPLPSQPDQSRSTNKQPHGSIQSA